MTTPDNNIPSITSTDLHDHLLSLDDHTLLTIILDTAKKEGESHDTETKA